jgi:hypothetical protein
MAVGGYPRPEEGRGGRARARGHHSYASRTARALEGTNVRDVEKRAARASASSVVPVVSLAAASNGRFSKVRRQQKCERQLIVPELRGLSVTVC